MELIEVKSLIWAQKGKLYVIYEKVVCILVILRFKSIHLLFYTFMHMFITEFYDYILSISLHMLNLKLCEQLKH
jgi:hypothetical protein